MIYVLLVRRNEIFKSLNLFIIMHKQSIKLNFKVKELILKRKSYILPDS